MMPVSPDALTDPILKSLKIESMELQAGVLVAQHKMRAAKKIYANAASRKKSSGITNPRFTSAR